MNTSRPEFEATAEAAETARVQPGADPYVQNVVRAIDDCIAHHPWGAVCCALMCGLGVGMLLRNSRECSEEMEK